MRLIQYRGIVDPICDRADFNADVAPRRFVVIFGQSGRRATDEEGKFSRRFVSGDRAVCGSYNLIYTGIIEVIGEKTITIREDLDGARKRLSILDFIRRNWNFDAAKIDAENAEVFKTV